MKADPPLYWDHNAATPLLPEVAELLVQSVREAVESPGNPSSVHRGGRRARARLDSARARLARTLECDPREVTFTGSGSESLALAIKGAFGARKDPSRLAVVTSQIEHPAALAAVEQLRQAGARVVAVAPERNGRMDPTKLIAALGPDTALCSLMWANNETGVLQPVAEVARACRERGVLFHTDAVQAVGKIPVSFKQLDADLLSFSGHKLGAPAGVAALLVRRGVPVAPLVPGHQEGGRRGGTPNVALIESLTLALELRVSNMSEDVRGVTALRDRFEGEMLQAVPALTINGADVLRVGNTSSVTFDGVDGEALLIALDLDGICASSGAACASGTLSPSHVLTAMQLSSAQAHGSLRFSLGVETTEANVIRVVASLTRHLDRVRASRDG